MKFLKTTLAFLMLPLFFTACSLFDDCNDVVCNNDGVCVNGECDCPTNFTGPSCDQEVTPQSISITGITLNSMPANNDGADWDTFGGGPDVYYVITKDGDEIARSETFNDSFTANWNAAVSFNDPAETYEISIFDEDDNFNADDAVGGISFSPYNAGTAFPTTVELTCATCTVNLTLNGLTYSF